MAAAAKLLIDIAADIAKLRTDFTQANQVLEGFGRAAEKVGSTFRTAIGAIGAGVSLASLKSLIDAVGGIADAADKVQLSTDSFQALTAAMRDAGVATETTANLLAKAGQTLGKAFDGEKEAVELMKRLNVGLLDAQGNAASFEETLPRVAKAILDIENPMQRASAAAAFFGGKVGKEAIPALEAMARGTDALKKEFASQVIPEETIRRFDEFGDSINALKVEQIAKLADMLDSLVTPGTIAAWNDAKTAWAGFILEVKGSASGSFWPDTFINLENASRGLERIAGWATTAAAAIRDLTATPIPALGGAGGLVGGAAGLLAPPARGVAPATEPPPGTINFPPPPDPFSRFPKVVGGGGGKAPVDKFAEAMKRLREETEQTEVAIRAFERASGLPTKEAERLAKLASDVGSKTSQMLKGVADAGQQEQVKAAVQALENLKFSLDELKVTQQTADEVSRTFGDGQKELADRVYYLDKAYAAGKITADEYALALDNAREIAERQRLSVEALAGGIDSISAGFRQAATQLTQAQLDAQLGADLYNATLDTMTSAITEFVTTGQLNFQKLAQSFAVMLLEMTARWAAASLLRAAFGALPGVGGGGGGSPFGPGGNPFSFGGPRAMGGPVTAGVSYLVGEHGPERFIPRASGTIVPGGGGVTVNIVNNAPARVAAEQRNTGGGITLDVVVEAIESGIAGRMSRGQGPLDKVMQGRFGVTPRGRQ